MLNTTLYVKNESIKLSKRLFSEGCLIPINVINNIKKPYINNIELQIKFLCFYDLSNKHKNILNDIDNQWKSCDKDYCKKKSYHYACLITGNNYIIKTNDYNRTYCNRQVCTSMHAEHNVIHHYYNIKRNKKKQNKIDTLIVIRYDKFGNKCNSRPCGHCMFIIKSNNIKKIIYSYDNNTYCLEYL